MKEPRTGSKARRHLGMYPGLGLFIEKQKVCILNNPQTSISFIESPLEEASKYGYALRRMSGSAFFLPFLTKGRRIVQFDIQVNSPLTTVAGDVPKHFDRFTRLP